MLTAKTSKVLEKAACGGALSDAELTLLLELDDQDSLNALHATARELRRRYFGDTVFMYGFVYFSTYCHNDCAFCYYRHSNTAPPRYRKDLGEVLRIAEAYKGSGVHLLDLTMGEDPQILDDPDWLGQLVAGVRQRTGLPLMLSPGVLGKRPLQDLADAGCSFYALYQETYALPLFKRLRLGQDFERRLAAKRSAREYGMLIEEGLLTGVGDTAAQLLVSLRAMQDLSPEQVRVMTFVPGKGIPLAAGADQLRRGDRDGACTQVAGPDFSAELKIISILRLLFPECLIPASLDVEGLAGLAPRLEAGANVVTSIIQPYCGLVGVANASKDIEEGCRSVAGVQKVLQQLRMTVAAQEDFDAWLAERRKASKP